MTMWLLENSDFAVAVSDDPEKLKAYAVRLIHPRSEVKWNGAMKKWKWLADADYDPSLYHWSLIYRYKGWERYTVTQVKVIV